MRHLYHATPFENISSIASSGIKKSIEGYVYTTEKPEQAAYFLALRGIKHILVLEIKVYKKDENKIIETTDHNYNYFKFKCYGYKGDIDTSMITKYIDYLL